MRFGIVGCGAIAGKYAQAIDEMDHARIVAATAHSMESARRFADRVGCDACPTISQLVQRDDVDAVIICSPSGAHGEAALAAARAHKHVVVEKPIEVTLEKIDAVIETCHKHKVQLHCIFNNRYKPVYQFVKRAIDQERLGRMISVNANIKWYRPREYYTGSSWRGTWQLDGGGALMNQTIHYVDLLLWLAGDVSHTFGYARTLLHEGIEAEDTAVATLEFASGAIGSIVTGTSFYPGLPAQLQLTGTRGTIVISDDGITNWSFCDTDPLDDEVEHYLPVKDNRSFAEPMAISHADHKAQLCQIVDAIETNGPETVSGEEARKAVELILSIYRSSRERREITMRHLYP